MCDYEQYRPAGLMDTQGVTAAVDVNQKSTT